MHLSGTAFHPDLGVPVRYEAIPLSVEPDTQVAQTIARMRRHVLEDARSQPILREAAAIQARGGDPCAATFWYVKDRVGFRQDAELAAPIRPYLDDDAVEVLIRPRDLVNMRTPLEDCDGFASLLPSLLRAQGVPCSFVTVAADPREPGRFSHVYVACYPNGLDGERVSLDASHGPYPGWESVDTGQVTRVQEWKIDGPDWFELLAIAAVLYAAARIWGIL